MLVLQVLVPLRALLDERDRQPFGWSMYATETRYPDIELELGDGALRRVAFAEVVARRRPEIDYRSDLPPYLCERYPEAREVRLSFESPQPEVTSCP